MEYKERGVCSTKEMVKYSFGAWGESLFVNTFGAFSLLYYTDALGLLPQLAGKAIAISAIWDAFTDPVMGYVSDNTRCRYGKRHPYIIIGGILSALCFFFIWNIPNCFKSNQDNIFWYLVITTLLFRTAYTVFVVPFTALGFEVCSQYAGRTKLQGIRTGMSMAANFCGPALAWWIFFGKNIGTRDTSNPQNYVNMGSTFSVIALFFILLMAFFTFKYAKDSRYCTKTEAKIGNLFYGIKDVVFNKYARWVFSFVFLVIIGVVIVSSLQMYVFEHFLVFSGFEKTIAHGGTMLGMGIGSLLGVKFVRRFDKKRAVFILVIFGVTCELILAFIFLSNTLKPSQILSVMGFKLPIAFIVFSLLHSAYWFSNGVTMPVSLSMIADISEVNQIQTGINKDGIFASMYSFAQKAAVSLGLLLSGYGLYLTGFESGLEQQTQEAVKGICLLMFIVGPTISLLGLLVVSRYPLNKKVLTSLHENN